MREQIKSKKELTGFANLEKFGVKKSEQLNIKGGNGGVTHLPEQ